MRGSIVDKLEKIRLIEIRTIELGQMELIF